MTTLGRNVLFRSSDSATKEAGEGCCRLRHLSPASYGIYESVARVTEHTGLCNVNVIQSGDSLQAWS